MSYLPSFIFSVLLHSFKYSHCLQNFPFRSVPARNTWHSLQILKTSSRILHPAKTIYVHPRMPLPFRCTQLWQDWIKHLHLAVNKEILFDLNTMPLQNNTHTHTLTVHVTDHNNSWSLLINNTHFCAQRKANLQNRDEEWGINEVDMYLRI